METKGRIEIVQSLNFLNADFGLISRESLVGLVSGIFDAAFASLYQQMRGRWLDMQIKVKRPFICFIEDMNDSGQGFGETINYSLEFFEEENKLALCLTIIGFLCSELWKVMMPFSEKPIRAEESDIFTNSVMAEVSVLMKKIPLEFKQQILKSYMVFVGLIQKFLKEENPEDRVAFNLFGLSVACFSIFRWVEEDNISIWEEKIFSEKSYDAVFAKLMSF